MSTPNPVLVPVLVAIAVSSLPLPAGNVAQASISVTVTDSTGEPQSPVVLTGVETPTPWAFLTNVAPGVGSVSAQALDTNGQPIGAADVVPFSITAQATYNAPGAISVTPVTNTAVSAAAHTAAAKKA